jgi:GT2 family glycosyltransferase
MAHPTISVAVCSAGRPDLLVGCLSSLGAVEDWQPGDEVVVVLNGPDRPNKARLEHVMPDVAYVIVEEEELGVSRARNIAWHTASGEVVVYLDDDARPHAGWIGAWRLAFGDESLHAAGGPIELSWTAGAPSWFDARLRAYWSALDLGNDWRAAPPAGRGFGANLAVRRTALAAVGGFDERWGRGGTRVEQGEELDVLGRIDQSGRRVAWVPSARVDHLVGAERARLRWILRRAHSQGRADVALGATRAARWSPVTTGWLTVGRRLVAEPRRWRATMAVDFARRARLAGRAGRA